MAKDIVGTIQNIKWRRTRSGDFVATFGDDECILKANRNCQGRLISFKAIVNGEPLATGKRDYAQKVVGLRLLKLFRDREGIMTEEMHNTEVVNHG